MLGGVILLAAVAASLKAERLGWTSRARQAGLAMGLGSAKQKFA